MTMTTFTSSAKEREHLATIETNFKETGELTYFEAIALLGIHSLDNDEIWQITQSMPLHYSLAYSINAGIQTSILADLDSKQFLTINPIQD